MGDTGLLVIFTCNHCPYAIAIWERLIALYEDATKQGINMLAINPNIHPDYPTDSPEAMLNKIQEWNIPFPYLVDQTQATAKAYQAQCTPDLYLLNSKHELVYHGRLDDNWQEPSKVSTQELKLAFAALTEGAPIPSPQHPSLGCSIKWHHA